MKASTLTALTAPSFQPCAAQCNPKLQNCWRFVVLVGGRGPHHLWLCAFACTLCSSPLVPWIFWSSWWPWSSWSSGLLVSEVSLLHSWSPWSSWSHSACWRQEAIVFQFTDWFLQTKSTVWYVCRLYICIYAYIHIYTRHIGYVYGQHYTYIVYVCMYVSTLHVCTYAHINTIYIHIYICTVTYISMYIRIGFA